MISPGWGLGIWVDAGLCAIHGGNSGGRGEAVHGTAYALTPSHSMFNKQSLDIYMPGTAWGRQTKSLPGRTSHNGTFNPLILPTARPTQVALHPYFPKWHRGGQEKKREERAPKASFIPTLCLLQMVLDTRNHPRTVQRLEKITAHEGSKDKACYIP